ncbi:hypothetical protein CXF86_19110 [Shewanella sp. GutCb]|uniref:hypothetical protein n=1 Tax=Shewanella sp. GutCb TaxID=2058315 RepID=UPI000C7ACB3B|nr:hypothetical protein [Shewanella sp. GutCb]PKG73161.1 hypothetical protein CXF86_19110 [Shewanella sp. GutCb]
MNRRQLARYQTGRLQRLAFEVRADSSELGPASCPLYSHDATWQSQFWHGWNSVNRVDIQTERLKLRALHSQTTPSIARQSLNEIHQMLRSHS